MATNINRREFVVQLFKKYIYLLSFISLDLFANNNKKLTQDLKSKSIDDKCKNIIFVDEKNDKQAKSLLYKEDSDHSELKNIKKDKNGIKAKLQKCANCNFYNVDNKSQISCKKTEWAPCLPLSNKYVRASGWCVAWLKTMRT